MADLIKVARRLQENRDVSLVANSAGQCILSTQLETTSSASTAIATGVMFSVTAKQNMEITSFEFAHFPFDGDLQVQIYTLQGTDYLSNRNQPGQWTLVSDTTGVESPDEGDDDIAISPRGDMIKTVPLVMNAGESRSFYFTLKSQHLKLDDSSFLTTGQEYFSDSMLQTNVGIGIRLSNFPSTDDDVNRAFQGRIHYRSIESCPDLSTETVVRVAVNPTEVPQSPSDVFQSAFTAMLDGQVDWARWKRSHGLRLSTLSGSPETKFDCTEYGFTNGCLIYDNTLTLTHYESLSSDEVELEVIRGFERNNNSSPFDGQSKMVYIGPPVVSRYYRLELVGPPADTILKFLQREYIGSVTLDFLDSFSDEKPKLVDVVSQDFSRRLRESDLRGARQLQVGVITAEAFVYGIADDSDAFFDAVEDAFRSNEQAYRTHLQTEQLRPSEINEGDDLGAIFEDVIRVSVKTNETSSGDVEAEDNTWIIICSVGIGLSFLFLVYRLCKDFCLVKDGEQIKRGQSLSARKESKTSSGMVEASNGPSNYFYGWRNNGERAKEAPNDGSNRSAKKKIPGGSSPRPGSGKSNASREDRSSKNKRPNGKKGGSKTGSRSPKPQGFKKPSGSKGKPSSSRSDAQSQSTQISRPTSGSSKGSKKKPRQVPKNQQRR